MKDINKEMAEYLFKYHMEYETTRANKKDMQNVFSLIKYCFDEIEELKKKCQVNE